MGWRLIGTGTSGNVVLGNLIGTNVTGSTALGNATIGVLLYEGPSDNLIGGTTVTARNIISGNGWSGVDIYSSNDNLVEGNFVGTDVTGDIALGNNGSNPNYGFAQGGITMSFGSAGNTIGGLTAIPGTGAGNLISGNTFAGVNAYGAGLEQFSGRQPHRHQCDRRRSRSETSPFPGGFSAGWAFQSATRPTPSWASRAGETSSRATATVPSTVPTSTCLTLPAAWCRAITSALTLPGQSPSPP